MTPEEEVHYGLLRDEWLYVATKETSPAPRAGGVG